MYIYKYTCDMNVCLYIYILYIYMYGIIWYIVILLHGIISLYGVYVKKSRFFLSTHIKLFRYIQYVLVNLCMLFSQYLYLCTYVYHIV